MTNLPLIKLYSDGGASPNPGKGAFGIILVHKEKRKEFSQGFRKTTNNRMELRGVIAGLNLLKKKSEVHVYTDSKYVVDGIEKGWAKKWRAKGWMRNKSEKAINPDLWERLLKLIEFHDVKLYWVKGHNGHPENERCDALVGIARRRKPLMIDKGYENLISGKGLKLDLK